MCIYVNNHYPKTFFYTTCINVYVHVHIVLCINDICACTYVHVYMFKNVRFSTAGTSPASHDLPGASLPEARGG